MNTQILPHKAHMSRTSTYHINLGGRRIRLRADHRIMLAMLPVIMAAREAVQASGQTGRAA